MDKIRETAEKPEAQKYIEKTELQNTLTDPRRSAIAKYQDVMVGSSGKLRLMKYEILTSLIGAMPGAAGLLLRQKLYRTLLGKMGRGVALGRSITIRHPHKIHLGDNVVIDDYAVLDAKGAGNKGIVIGDNVIIGRNTVPSCKNGDIIIGNNTNIALNCFIQSAQRVVIGRNVLFAAYCYVIGGGNHATDRTDIPVIAQGQIVKGITVKDNCWIGAAVKILDGVTIERDCIIGAGAVVNKDLPKYTVAVGIPAKILRSRISEKA